MSITPDTDRRPPRRQSSSPPAGGGTDRDRPSCGHHGRVTRRAVLGALAAAGVGAVAGCLGGGADDAAVPDPVALDGGKQCDVCGMVIADHPGPNGQIFYRDHAPEGHDNPAWFDSVKELFSYHFEKQRFDWEAEIVYATDYSTVDYTLTTERGTSYISSPVEPASFADATNLVFVVGSEVHGGMGPDLIPFSARADAAAFRDDHGGELVWYEDVDEGILRRTS